MQSTDDVPELPEGPSDASIHLMLTVLQVMAAKTMYAAVETGLIDQLAKGPATGSKLSRTLGTHAPALRRLLRALAGLGLVREDDGDRYELTGLARPLRDDAPDSVRGLVLLGCGPEMWGSWGELVSAVRTGEPAFNVAHGKSWAEYYKDNPGPARTFNRAMAEHTRDTVRGVLAAAELHRFRCVVDVGGGDGTLVSHALCAHPGLEGVVFDVPAGLADTAKTLADAGVADRARPVGGDFFESLPGGADAYLLKEIIHDWDDERSIAILRNVRAAIAPKGRLLVVERMLPESVTGDGDPVKISALMEDMLMLAVTGGRERTESEFHHLMGAAGFMVDRISAPVPPFGFRVIEAVPA